MASPGHLDEEGRGQAGREAGGVARQSAHASGTQLLGEVEKTTEEEAGWAACWLGRPAAAGLHREEAQVSLPLLFLFSNFSDICFDLIKILNHLITLCRFLQELAILFQSSFINGIIFGQYFIYITIYIQSKYLCLNSNCPK